MPAVELVGCEQVIHPRGNSSDNILLRPLRARGLQWTGPRKEKGGHHDIVTEGDIVSQRVAMTNLGETPFGNLSAQIVASYRTCCLTAFSRKLKAIHKP